MAQRKISMDWRQVPELVWRSLVFLVALAILIIVTTRWNRWQGNAASQVTNDAYVQADLTPVATHVQGYLSALPVQDYERVRAGQVIAQIADGDYRASVAQAQAALAAAVAQTGVLQAQKGLQAANVAAARAVAASTAAAIEQNARDLARQKELLQTGSSSAEAGEKLQTTKLQLAAQLAQNRAQAEAASRQLGVLSAQALQAEAAQAAARAAVQLAQINLGYTQIRAPQDGVLGQRQVKPGQYVSVGAQITSLTPLPKVWVIANYKETQITHMKVGDPAKIRVDTFPDRVISGHVVALAPGSGAQFALLPPDNATGNFTKVVQRVAVKIAIDDAAGLADRLLPGLSVVATVDARESPSR